MFLDFNHGVIANKNEMWRNFTQFLNGTICIATQISGNDTAVLEVKNLASNHKVDMKERITHQPKWDTIVNIHTTFDLEAGNYQLIIRNIEISSLVYNVELCEGKLYTFFTFLLCENGDGLADFFTQNFM